MFQNHLEGKKQGEEQTKQDWPRVDIVEAGGGDGHIGNRDRILSTPA